MQKSGERIRQLRIKNGLTQEEAAETLNIDRSFYSRIETGRKGCSVDLFVQMSEFFHVSLDYLILGRYPGIASKYLDAAQLKERIDELVDRIERFKAALE